MAYQLAKYNIARVAKTGDFFIYHHNDFQIPALNNEMMPVSKMLPFALNDASGVHTFISEGEVFSKQPGMMRKICDLKDLKFPCTENITC
jgi:hypothetical protein